MKKLAFKSIEINGNLYFYQKWDGEIWNLNIKW